MESPILAAIVDVPAEQSLQDIIVFHQIIDQLTISFCFWVMKFLLFVQVSVHQHIVQQFVLALQLNPLGQVQLR